MSALSICAMRCVKQLIRTQTWLQKPLKEVGAKKGRLALYSYFTVIQMPHLQKSKLFFLSKAAQVSSWTHETPNTIPSTWGGIRRTDRVVHQQGERQRLPERQVGQTTPPATGWKNIVQHFTAEHVLLLHCHSPVLSLRNLQCMSDLARGT